MLQTLEHDFKSLWPQMLSKLFATYFKAYRNVLGETLPALLPQVYLHYDPAVMKTLRHRLPLPRQRMDFCYCSRGVSVS